MTIRELQRRAVDGIKRHALAMSIDSPRAQAHILTEYLWIEEGSETAALHRTTATPAPEWVDRLATNQLADEVRHAALLRDRLVALDARTDRTPPSVVRGKLWWMARATAPFMHAFAAGPIVVVLAVAAQLESTGVRMFTRHLGVLDDHGVDDPTTAVLRSIVADEKRHAKSCAAAVDRLVHDDERERLAALRERVARVDRAFGITISVAFWLAIAAHTSRDRLRAVATRDRVRSARGGAA